MPQRTDQAQVQDCGGTSPQPKPKAKAACRFYLTDKGCSKGSSCTFSHAFTRKERQGRCWTCGSTQHHQPECSTRSGTSPTAKAGGNAKPPPSVKAIAGAPPPPTPSTASSASTTTAQATPAVALESSTPVVPESELRSLLQEASAMLKEIRQLKVLSLTTTQLWEYVATLTRVVLDSWTVERVTPSARLQRMNF